MFSIIDIENLISITEITDEFILIQDIENIFTIDEVNKNGS